jgi:hypothetical protein
MKVILLMILAYDFASTWNDANKGGFTEPAPIIFAVDELDAESDFNFEYAYVPSHPELKALFCLRKADIKAVNCFYAHEGEGRGAIVIEAVIPRNL